MASADKVVDDMRGGRIPASATEPFTAGKAFNDASSIVNTTVSAE